MFVGPAGQAAWQSRMRTWLRAMAHPRYLKVNGRPVFEVLIPDIFVAQCGGSVDAANALLAQFAAVVEAWRPGEEGARAILDIISGRVNPSGKLASQWAQNVGQMNSGSQPWLARRRAKWVANQRSTPDPTDGRVYDPYVATAYSSLPLFRFVRARPALVRTHCPPCLHIAPPYIPPLFCTLCRAMGSPTLTLPMPRLRCPPRLQFPPSLGVGCFLGVGGRATEMQSTPLWSLRR
jgi:hypothetical protein